MRGPNSSTSPLSWRPKILFYRPSEIRLFQTAFIANRRKTNNVEKKTKIRLAGLIILATAVLSLILVLFTDSWPLAIAIAVVVMASASAGFYWYSRRQQGQFIERLKKFDIDPEKGRVNEANLRRMYHSGGQAQKDAITIICMSQECSVEKRTLCLKNAPPAKSRWRRRAEMQKGMRQPRMRR